MAGQFDVENYSVYDEGYVSGSSISIFVGPIWVDEVVSLRLSSASAKKPVYSYSSPYYNRLLVGNYSVAGSLGIAYKESDYFMKCLAQAQNAGSDLELKQMIEKQKSQFANTLKSRMTAAAKQASLDLVNVERMLKYSKKGDSRYGELLQKKAELEAIINNNIYIKQINSYVERVSREIEMMSYVNVGSTTTNLTRVPYTFKLTIVKGKITDPNCGFEMYEDVEVLGTDQLAANDDSAQIMLYNIMGKK